MNLSGRSALLHEIMCIVHSGCLIFSAANLCSRAAWYQSLGCPCCHIAAMLLALISSESSRNTSRQLDEHISLRDTINTRSGIVISSFAFSGSEGTFPMAETLSSQLCHMDTLALSAVSSHVLERNESRNKIVDTRLR